MNAFRQKKLTRYLDRIIYWAILAEAFMIALSPMGAALAAVVGLVCYLLRLGDKNNWHWHSTPFDIPVLIFVVCSICSIFVSPDRFFSAYNFCNLAGLYVITYILVSQNITYETQIREIVYLLGASLCLCLLYGVFQAVVGIDTSEMRWVDGNAFPELKNRIFSTWENPNIFAAYLDVAICMVFAFARYAEGRVRWGLFGVLVTALACLGLTYARGALLTLAVVFMVYGLLKDRRIFAGCIILGAGLLLLEPALLERVASVFSPTDSSSQMRLGLWTSTLAMIEDYPLFGIGWGAYFMVYPSYDYYLQGAAVKIVHAHNVYLNYIVEIGIPGALAFFYFLFGNLYRCFFVPPQDSSRFLRALLLGIGMSLVTVALNGITDDVLFNIPSSMLLWLLCALSAVTIRLRQHNHLSWETLD